MYMYTDVCIHEYVYVYTCICRCSCHFVVACRPYFSAANLGHFGGCTRQQMDVSLKKVGHSTCICNKKLIGAFWELPANKAAQLLFPPSDGE